MKKGRFLLLCGFIALNSLVYAQDYTFRVLANKGANEIKSGDGWQPVKTGASLKLGDELRVTENASIGLVHSSGKPLEVKKANTYKVADLASQISGGSSVLNKYTDFILSSNSAEAKKNRLSATGAVHRGLGIKVYLPNNQYASVFNNIVYVNWDKAQKGPFTVSFLNMFDDVLLKVETPENSVSIDLNDPKFAGETAILVEIQSKSTGTKSDERYLIKKLSPGEHEKINVAYSDVMKELKDETAFNKLFLAGFYEQNKLLIDAITSYEQAMKLAPDDPTYKDYYEEFLLRNKLKVTKP
ncbi:MAG TPA: hypothetical protein PKJ83_18180 [Cyclobacteriaceae bacterium]|nr:hypothetical protein [Cyclobacteriaceae bacterium]